MPVDTNILVYADRDSGSKHLVARDLVAGLGERHERLRERHERLGDCPE